MPRRNLLVILGACLIALICYQRADRNPLGRWFSEVADKIEDRYVNQVDRRALWTAAVQGMVAGLKDPYSEYIPVEEAAELDETLNQEFAGIGIQVAIDPDTNRLTVISPIVGSPAYRAGILAGDVIAEIDGRSTRDLGMPQAVKLLRGKVGDPIRLTIERAGQKEPIKLPPIRREAVAIESVMGDTRGPDDTWNFLIRRDPDIGYIRVVNFGQRTGEELKAALEQLRDQNVQGLILDLRNDPGGLLGAAIDVANLLLEPGQPIVELRARDRQLRREYLATTGEKFLGFPVVVLVNRGSASASEVVAAALQDAGRAVVIGERTWGKGTVQTMIPLHSAHGTLKLTTADYVRPSGHNIHRPQGAGSGEQDPWGVLPDEGFEVKMADEQLQRWMKWRGDRDVVRPRNAADGKARAAEGPSAGDESLEHDPPLRRAVEYLESTLR